MSKIQNKKIVAKEYPLKDILSNNKYSIDYFQREYRWRKENIDQLIDGLYNNNEYTPKDTDEDSVRFMADRYNDIKDSFPDDLQGQALESFMYWVINNIVIVKIEAYSEENAKILTL